VERLLDYVQNTPADPLRSRACVEQRVALIDRNRAALKALKLPARVKARPV
jgi:4-O-beta-D-mannosyl-D-glucose phosphorylase